MAGRRKCPDLHIRKAGHQRLKALGVSTEVRETDHLSVPLTLLQLFKISLSHHSVTPHSFIPLFRFLPFQNICGKGLKRSVHLFELENNVNDDG
jgi:hypothetical protein